MMQSLQTAPASVVNLAEWKSQHQKPERGKTRISLEQFDLTPAEVACGLILHNVLGGPYGDYQRSVRKVLGIRPSDELVTIAADVDTVRPDVLIAVAIENEPGFQVGYLRRDSLTQWYVSIGDYEGDYFHPSSIRRFVRVVDGLRGGIRLGLKCHLAQMPRPSATIIAWPDPPQSWSHVVSVATHVLARPKRRKEARR
jgi:hypothetical protein